VRREASKLTEGNVKLPVRRPPDFTTIHVLTDHNAKHMHDEFGTDYFQRAIDYEPTTDDERKWMDGYLCP